MKSLHNGLPQGSYKHGWTCSSRSHDTYKGELNSSGGGGFVQCESLYEFAWAGAFSYFTSSIYVHYTPALHRRTIVPIIPLLKHLSELTECELNSPREHWMCSLQRRQRQKETQGRFIATEYITYTKMQVSHIDENTRAYGGCSEKTPK